MKIKFLIFPGRFDKGRLFYINLNIENLIRIVQSVLKFYTFIN